MPSITSEMVAILDEDSRPSDDWAQAALGLLGDPTVGAVPT